MVPRHDESMSAPTPIFLIHAKKLLGGGMLIFPGQISVSSVKRGRMLQLDQLNCQHQTTELVKRLIRDLRGLSSNPGYMLSSTILPYFILAQNFKISVIL